jgi:hypothetical protein
MGLRDRLLGKRNLPALDEGNFLLNAAKKVANGHFREHSIADAEINDYINQKVPEDSRDASEYNRD